MAKPINQIKWQELEIGNVVPEAGSARGYKTGDWRSMRPEWDKKSCIRCGVCWIFCPESCIVQDEYGYFEADYDYCKGCAICANECVTGCISMFEEEK